MSEPRWTDAPPDEELGSFMQGLIADVPSEAAVEELARSVEARVGGPGGSGGPLGSGPGSAISNGARGLLGLAAAAAIALAVGITLFSGSEIEVSAPASPPDDHPALAEGQDPIAVESAPTELVDDTAASPAPPVVSRPTRRSRPSRRAAPADRETSPEESEHETSENADGPP